MHVQWKPGTKLDLSNCISVLDQILSLWNVPPIFDSQHSYPSRIITILSNDPASVDDFFPLSPYLSQPVFMFI